MMKLLPQHHLAWHNLRISEEDIEVTIVLDCILYALMIMFQVICCTICVGDNISTE